ncbi:MAG: hypothetical protein WBD47_03145 [Phormidesmis sp.]
MATGQVTRGGATPRRFAALGNAHQDGVRMHPHTAIYQSRCAIQKAITCSTVTSTVNFTAAVFSAFSQQALPALDTQPFRDPSKPAENTVWQFRS